MHAINATDEQTRCAGWPRSGPDFSLLAAAANVSRLGVLGLGITLTATTTAIPPGSPTWGAFLGAGQGRSAPTVG